MKIVAFLVVVLLAMPAAAASPDAQSAYERVMKSGVIRCGYVVYDPVVRKDPNTGAVTGLLVDIMDEVAKRLEMKVDWTEDVPFVSAFEGLKTARYDAVCAPLWGWGPQARTGELVGPMYFYPIGAWVRADDVRFDKSLSFVNAPGIKISGVDGTFPLETAQVDFPKASAVSLPQISDYTQPLMEVKTKKADITFMDNNIGLRFLQNNPKSVKNVAADPPYKIFGQFILVNKGEHALQSMLQSMVNLMVLDGTMDRLITKYEASKGAYYRLPRPYALVQ